MASSAANKTLNIAELVEDILGHLVIIIHHEHHGECDCPGLDALPVLKKLCTIQRLNKTFQRAIKDKTTFRMLTFTEKDERKIEKETAQLWRYTKHSLINPILKTGEASQKARLQTMYSFPWDTKPLSKVAVFHNWQSDKLRVSMELDYRLYRFDNDMKMLEKAGARMEQASWSRQKATYNKASIELVIKYLRMGKGGLMIDSVSVTLPAGTTLGEVVGKSIELSLGIMGRMRDAELKALFL